MRIMLTVSYDGTNYSGWQVQPNALTVQELLEQAIEKVTGEKVRVTGSGRTDAGVHAEGQVAHFDTNSTVPPERFYKALNVYLPTDVRVLESKKAEDGFDANRSAKKKTYVYSLYLSDVEKPLKDRFQTRVDNNLDLSLMKLGAEIFVGEHDFKSMCTSGSSVKTTVRTIYNIDIEKHGEDLTVSVTGNGFLYNMVRILVGTLIEIGQGRISLLDAKKMLEEKTRSLGGKTLSAKGLCLKKVEYQ